MDRSHQIGIFFLIPPGTPFLDGSDPPPDAPYERGIMIYLRRDGIRCHTYIRDRGKVWLHPYIFIADAEAWLPGRRLLREMQKCDGLPDAVVYHYLSIILHLMKRGIRQGIAVTLLPKTSEAVTSGNVITNPCSARELVQQAADYIDRNLKDANLSAKEIATYINVSTGHLNRLFHQEKGVTAIQYLQQQRLGHAQNLLRTSSFSVNLIAHLCGFRNQSHFGHWFTKHTSLSPRQYRIKSLNV